MTSRYCNKCGYVGENPVHNIGGVVADSECPYMAGRVGSKLDYALTLKDRLNILVKVYGASEVEETLAEVIGEGRQ